MSSTWPQTGHDASNTNKTETYPERRINNVEYTASWNYGGGSGNEIIFDDNGNLVFRGSTSVTCINIENGEVLWTHSVTYIRSGGIAKLPNGNLVVLSSYGTSPVYGCLECIDPSDGSLIWTFSDDYFYRNIYYTSDGAIKVDIDGNIYFVAGNRATESEWEEPEWRHLYKVSPSGALVWRYSFPQEATYLHDHFSGNLCIDSLGNVYLPYADNYLGGWLGGEIFLAIRFMKIDSTGTQVWTRASFTYFPILSSDEARLFGLYTSGSGNNFCAVSVEDGSYIWAQSLGSFSGYLLGRDDEDNIYRVTKLGSSLEYWLRSHDKDGVLRWETQLSEATDFYGTGIIGGNNYIYIISADGCLSMYNCLDGSLVYSFSYGLTSNYYYKLIVTSDRVLVPNYSRIISLNHLMAAAQCTATNSLLDAHTGRAMRYAQLS